jgi:hypothetical protein
VYCLWDKFDAKKDKVVHLVSDVINATFAVVTEVAAVSIAANLSIRLPNVISNRLAGEIQRADATLTRSEPIEGTELTGCSLEVSNCAS